MRKIKTSEKVRRATHRKVLRARILRTLEQAVIVGSPDGPNLDRDVVRRIAMLQWEVDHV